jgi:hypothetical protein
MQQKIEPINKKEAAWIRQQLEAATKFVAQYSPADAGQPLTPAALDRAFAAWMASIATTSPDGNSVDPVINCVGIAFGQALVDELAFKWMIVTDEQGTDLAVHALPGRGDVLVFPTNFVAKRWERRETNFLEDTYRKIAADVERIAAEWRTRDT